MAFSILRSLLAGNPFVNERGTNFLSVCIHSRMRISFFFYNFSNVFTANAYRRAFNSSLLFQIGSDAVERWKYETKHEKKKKWSNA